MNEQNQQPERVEVVERGGAGGWTVAVVILVIVIAGILIWQFYTPAAAPADTDDSAAQVEVNVPLGDRSGDAAADSGASADATSGDAMPQ